MSPGSQFIEHHAKTENIRARIHLASERLLGAEKTRRARHRAGLRVQRGLGLCRRVRPSREAEVENFDTTVTVHADVRRLDIAMDDVLVSGGGQRLGYLRADVRDLGESEPPMLRQRVERVPFEILHCNERPAIVRFADFVNRADIRMVESGSGSCFSKEAFSSRHIVREIAWKNFQRRKPIQLRVFGQEHLAHSASAETAHYSILRHLCARGECIVIVRAHDFTPVMLSNVWKRGTSGFMRKGELRHTVRQRPIPGNFKGA
jgi:hypothetical protein